MTRLCYICGGPIVGEELFTYTSKGGVHFDHWKREKLGERPSSVDEATVTTLLEAVEDELRSIVRYKERSAAEEDEAASQLLVRVGKDAEKNAALLTKRVEELVGAP